MATSIACSRLGVRTRDATQCGTHEADRAFDAGLQDDCQFSQGHGKAIRLVCRQFIVLCRELGLFAHTVVAIDGSKFKAANNRDKNYTPGKIKIRQQELETSIDRYLSQLDTADRQEPEIAQARTERLTEKIAVLKKHLTELKAIEQRMLESPDQQLSLTDPDAHSMKGRDSSVVGYNVQTAVNTQHHSIVAHEVTMEGYDRSQLSNMAQQARVKMGAQDLTVNADRGYFKGEEIAACAQQGIPLCCLCQ